MLLLGLTLEGPWPVTDLSQAVVTVVLLAAVNSVLGLFLLGAVVRRGGAEGEGWAGSSRRKVAAARLMAAALIYFVLLWPFSRWVAVLEQRALARH